MTNHNDNRIDEYLNALPDWQRKNLELFRKLVHEVEPEVTEDWKWNVPIFMLKGKMLFAMSAFKHHTKYNFIANGALVNDTGGLFNNGLESNKSRAIDLAESDTIDLGKLKILVLQSIHLLK